MNQSQPLTKDTAYNESDGKLLLEVGSVFGNLRQNVWLFVIFLSN